MGNYKKYIILLGVILVIGVLLYWISNSEGAAKTNDPNSKKPVFEKGDSSTPLYNDTSKVKKTINPTGTYLLYQLLKTFDNTRSLRAVQTTSEEELTDVLPADHTNGKPNLYVSIIEDQALSYDDGEYLYNFVNDGNYAFIASDNFDDDLMELLTGYEEIIRTAFYDTSVFVNFIHPDYRQPKDLLLKNSMLNYHNRPRYTYVNLIDTIYLGSDGIRLDKVTYSNQSSSAMIKIGKGFFILHSMPSNLGNFNILQQDGKTHAEILFSHFPECNIYWHQNYGKYSEYRGVSKPKVKKEPKKKSRNSPLQHILKQPALLWAFILLIVGILIYIVIFTKRQQRIIPPVVSKENSSLQFVEVVSKLYFQQKQHNKLVKHIYTSFGLFVRERYYINILLKEEDLIIRLSEKSGIELEKIHSLISKLSNPNAITTESQLVELYKELNYFYENCN